MARAAPRKPVPPPSAPRRGSYGQARPQRPEGSLYAIGFVLILIFFTIRLPDTFLTTQNWLNISQQLSMLMVVAAGMTIVMVMGDFRSKWVGVTERQQSRILMTIQALGPAQVHPCLIERKVLNEGR